MKVCEKCGIEIGTKENVCATCDAQDYVLAWLRWTGKILIGFALGVGFIVAGFWWMK